MIRTSQNFTLQSPFSSAQHVTATSTEKASNSDTETQNKHLHLVSPIADLTRSRCTSKCHDLNHSMSSSSSASDPDETKTFVIMDGATGLGKGIAKKFAELGHNLVFTGRSEESISTATEDFASPRAIGITCEPTRLQEVQAVWDTTTATFGKVDYWINSPNFCESHAQENIASFFELRSNLLSTPRFYSPLETAQSNAAQVAITNMEEQGHGHLYLFEENNSLSQSLAHEAETAGSPVKISGINIGLAPNAPMTGFIKNQMNNGQLADALDPITTSLSQEVLKNTTNGKTLEWLTPFKAMSKLFSIPFNTHSTKHHKIKKPLIPKPNKFESDKPV